MKLLGVADLHFSPERADKFFRFLDYLKSKVIQEDIDGVIIAGDLLHKALLNSDRHGIPKLKIELMGLSQITKVYIIYGTLSHDSIGSLEIFENKNFRIIRAGQPMDIGNVILYALPEPSKQAFAGDVESLEKAGNNLNKAIDNLCLSYGVHRSNYPNKRAIVVGHGVVKGKATEEEYFVKHATNYVTEQSLKQINADLYVWGHIHDTIDFEDINGGYAGSLSYDWGELDYKPSIMAISVDNESISYVREPINYLPIRKKITAYSEVVEGYLTWLDIPEEDVDLDFTVEKLEELTKVKGCKYTVTKAEKEIIRNEGINELTNYVDMFRLWKPEATDEEIKACQEVYENDLKTGVIAENKVIKPLYFKAKGLKPFMEGVGKEEISFDWNNISAGITGLTGRGGMGKSTLMDLSKPFTELLSQPNTFPSLFEGNESYWETGFDVNGKEIVLKAFLKAGNKRTTAEYYAYEDGVPVQGCNKNLEPFNEYIYKTFGSPRLFATTVYRTQFEHNKNWKGVPLNPSLINADNSTLKALVHEFSGTDKDSALDYSKAKRKEIIDDIKAIELEIEVSNRQIGNIEELSNANSFVKHEIGIAETRKIEAETKIVDYTEKLESLKERVSKSDKAKQEIAELDNSLSLVKHELLSLKANMPILEDTEKLEQEIIELESKKLKNEEIKAGNDKLYKLYQEEFNTYTDRLKTIQESNDLISQDRRNIRSTVEQCSTRVNNNKAVIEITETKLKGLVEPCPKCGYVAEDVIEKEQLLKAKIEEHKKLLIIAESDLEQTEKSLADLPQAAESPKPPAKPILQGFDDNIEGKLNSAKIRMESVKDRRRDVAIATAKIEEKESTLAELQSKIEELKLLIDVTAESEKSSITILLNGENLKLQDIDNTIISKRQALAVLESKIEALEEQIKAIENLGNTLELTKSKLEIWDTMVSAWGRDGIPAMILENIAPTINAETNSILERFYPEMRIEVSTLRPDSTGHKMIEEFKINILNTETGRIKPINCLSGEERDFVLTALFSTFRKLNEVNKGVVWLWGLGDEIDSHVSEDLTPTFWDMVEDINRGTGRKYLAISHSPEAKARFNETFDIELI